MICPTCNSSNTELIITINKYVCWECNNQFSVKKTCNTCYFRFYLQRDKHRIRGMMPCQWCRYASGHRAWKPLPDKVK